MPDSLLFSPDPPATAPERMRVRFWGVRGSIPTPQATHLGVGGNTACVQVTLPDGTGCILDGGTGVRPLGLHLLDEAGGEQLDLHLFLSHFHWDHLQGLPFFPPLYRPTTRLTIYASDYEGLPADHLAAQMAAPFFPVPFDTVAADVCIKTIGPNEPVQLGALTLRAFPVHHTQHVLGFRLEAHGVSVVYCTDYEHGNAALDRLLLDTVRGTDLFICDAQYTPEEYDACMGWGHTTWAQAARLAREAEVGHLALFHHDPAHDDDALAAILANAQTLFPATSLATEGTTWDL